MEIFDRSPADYFPEYTERLSSDELAHMCYWNALSTEWDKMNYDEFLRKRHKAIATVICGGFSKLWNLKYKVFAKFDFF